MTLNEEKDKDKKIPSIERRAAKCALGKSCEVADRQTELSLEVQYVRDELTELKTSIQDMLDIFDDFKTILRALKGLASILKWLALTGVAAIALYNSITHWPKGH